MRLWPALFLLLCACTQFPELEALDSPATRTAEYPALLPMDRLLSADIERATPQQARSIAGRAAALRARARKLRSAPVVDTPTQRRMSRGVQSPL